MVNTCVLWQRWRQPPLHCSLVFMQIQLSNVAHKVQYGEYLCGIAEIAAATTGVYVDTVQQSCTQSSIWWIFVWCCRDRGSHHWCLCTIQFSKVARKVDYGEYLCGVAEITAANMSDVCTFAIAGPVEIDQPVSSSLLNTQDPIRSTPQNTSSVNFNTAELGSVIVLSIFSRTCDSRTLFFEYPPLTPTPLLCSTPLPPTRRVNFLRHGGLCSET